MSIVIGEWNSLLRLALDEVFGSEGILEMKSHGKTGSTARYGKTTDRYGHEQTCYSSSKKADTDDL